MRSETRTCSTSQTRMVRSSDPEATQCESYVHAMSEMPWVCPESVARGESLRVSHTFTVLSAAVVRRDEAIGPRGQFKSGK